MAVPAMDGSSKELQFIILQPTHKCIPTQNCPNSNHHITIIAFTYYKLVT
jgi:hypothetical protein